MRKRERRILTSSKDNDSYKFNGRIKDKPKIVEGSRNSGNKT